MLVLAAACAGGAGDGADVPSDDPAPGPGDEPDEAIVVTVSTDRETYATGDPIELTLLAENRSDAPVTLEFTSGQRYDFMIEGSDGETRWTWSAARGFMQALGSETIPAGGELRWSETVTDVELPAGSWTAVGMVTNRDGPLTDRAGFTVR